MCLEIQELQCQSFPFLVFILPWDTRCFSCIQKKKKKEWDYKSVPEWKTLDVLWFLFVVLNWPAGTKQSKRNTFTFPYQEGPHVSHHTLHVHSALSPSGWLFWLDGCNLICGASIHGWYVSLSLCSRAAGLTKTWRVSQGCFSPLAF